MADYSATLEAKVSSIPSLIRTANDFKSQHLGDLNRYHGGMPIGLLVAIAAIESGGRMVAGDASLGEYGYFQVAANTERDFSVPSGTRLTPLGNIFLASLEYNVEAKRLALKFPQVIDGTLDQWLLARSVFAIGRSGTYKLVTAATAAGFTRPGDVFGGTLRWADATGLAPDKQHYRLHLINDVTLPIARNVGQMWPGLPSAPTGPVPYTLPADVRGKMGSGVLGFVLVAALVGYFFIGA